MWKIKVTSRILRMWKRCWVQGAYYRWSFNEVGYENSLKMSLPFCCCSSFRLLLIERFQAPLKLVVYLLEDLQPRFNLSTPPPAKVETSRWCLYPSNCIYLLWTDKRRKANLSKLERHVISQPEIWNLHCYFIRSAYITELRSP